jgi:two-component system cell cycle response regulator
MPTKILTVDDSMTIRLIIRQSLKQYDCQVLEASNGVEGLSAASREKPDLIVLDLTMPVMDGYEMLTRLKLDPDLKNIPIIMLTSEASRENVLRIAKVGVRDYLVKPFRKDEIIERINRIVPLKLKESSLSRPKKFDDPVQILAVDDMPAIFEQITQGLKGTNWTVVTAANADQAYEMAEKHQPHVLLVSLLLPDQAAFTLFQMLRAHDKTKMIPVFGMCVKTAVAEQATAQQLGFSSIVTKPIDVEDLKGRICRALRLDTSARYFKTKDQVLVISAPAIFTAGAGNEILLHLRPKVTQAVESGISNVVLDLSAVQRPELSLMKMAIEVFQLAGELALRLETVGSPVVREECGKYGESKNWQISSSLEEALGKIEATVQKPEIPVGTIAGIRG